MLTLKALTAGIVVTALCGGAAEAGCRTIRAGRTQTGWSNSHEAWGGAYAPTFNTNTSNSATNIEHEVQLNVVTTAIGNSASISGASSVTVNQTSQPISISNGYGSGYGYAQGATGGNSGQGPSGGLIGVGGGNTVLPITTGTTGNGNTVLPITTAGPTVSGNNVLPINASGLLSGNGTPISVGDVANGNGVTTVPGAAFGASQGGLPAAGSVSGPSSSGAGANLGAGLQPSGQGGSAIQLCPGCASQLTGGVGG